MFLVIITIGKMIAYDNDDNHAHMMIMISTMITNPQNGLLSGGKVSS